MINNLHLKNFKCFVDQGFDFAPLTVFCGSNSAGKSTAIQALLSVKQNLSLLHNCRFKLDGPLFSFGRLSDLQSHNPSDNEISIEINNFKLNISDGNLSAKECNIPSDNIEGLTHLNELFLGDFIYLCAERYGPRSSFESVGNNEELDIGIYGQFALSEYNAKQSQPVRNIEFATRMYGGDMNSTETIGHQPIFTDALVERVMRQIYPNFKMKVTESNEIDRVYNTYMYGSSQIRPVNVGFGVSYVLPIVIAACLIRPGGILIVENPEVHLHPSAQSSLIKILCELSKTNVQVIIETHSDHIINGIRVFAKDSNFDENNNIINSISEESGVRVVKKIHVDEDGNLTDLDKGFFDQINLDLMRLF